MPVSHPDTSTFEPGMVWAEADLDAAIELLRALRTGRAPALQSATEALRTSLRSRFAPEVVGTIAATVFNQSVDNKQSRA